MSPCTISVWALSEIRFFITISEWLKTKESITQRDWEQVANTFGAEQPRHWPGGDLHDADPWVEKSFTWRQYQGIFNCFSRIVENIGRDERILQDEEEMLKTAEALIELSRSADIGATESTDATSA